MTPLIQVPPTVGTPLQQNSEWDQEVLDRAEFWLLHTHGFLETSPSCASQSEGESLRSPLEIVLMRKMLHQTNVGSVPGWGTKIQHASRS